MIAPKPVGDVTWVNASYRSALGPISVQWERAGRSFVLNVDLPADAAVILPDESRHIPGPGLHTLRCPLE